MGEKDLDIGNYIWNKKYRYKVEKDFYATASRVATAVATTTDEYAKYYEAISSLKFIPGGRILANAGTDTKNTWVNCFVMPDPEDTMEGIFDCLRQSALTLKAGGGIGLNFSNLRAAGSILGKSGGVASGPVSFMRMWDTACSTIMSAGNRRGAMMGVLNCYHPDIIEFCRAKSKKNNGLTNFNLSVSCTHDFMNAVLAGKQKETDIWYEITRNAYECGDPGVLFIDTINEENPLKGEIITATNPCGEQPLPAYGACVLGSINLNEFSIGDYSLIEDTVEIAVNFLNKVIDRTPYPLKEQEVEAKYKRRIGLGVMGLATLLNKHGIPYGSDDAVNVTEKLLSVIHKQAVKSSNGRNSHVTCVAPTGTTSLLVGNVSSGIEPIFSNSYKRTIAGYGEVEMSDPSGFCSKTAMQVTPEEHIAMAAAAQWNVDGAVSKTINVPESIPFYEFQNIYLMAYQAGLKGCTIFRPNSITGSVLSEKSEIKTACALKKRPDATEGKTYKIKTPTSSHAIYVTINDVDGKPFEIFINTKDVTHHQWISALTRMMSAVFRRADDATFVYEELKAIFDPNGGHWKEGVYYPSLIAEIGAIIEKHMGCDKDPSTTQGAQCPQCGQMTLRVTGGCATCDCGYSKCG